MRSVSGDDRRGDVDIVQQPRKFADPGALVSDLALPEHDPGEAD